MADDLNAGIVSKRGKTPREQPPVGLDGIPNADERDPAGPAQSFLEVARLGVETRVILRFFSREFPWQASLAARDLNAVLRGLVKTGSVRNQMDIVSS